MSCSIEASKFEHVAQSTTDAKVPPTKSIGVAMGAPRLSCPITFTSTPWSGLAALMPTDELPASTMLLKLNSEGGSPATRTIFAPPARLTLGSERDGPGPPPVIVTSGSSEGAGTGGVGNVTVVGNG